MAHTNRNPEAIEALGVPKSDQLGGEVKSEHSLHHNGSQPFSTDARREFILASLRRAGAGLRSTEAIAVTVSNIAGITIYGGDKNQTLSGTGEEDFIYGRDQRDTLNGGAGNDSLFGGDGRDVLNGGLGNDILSGGDAADTFVFSASSFGKDVITDFRGDTVQFDHTVFSNFAAVQSHMAQVGANTVITWDANNTVTLLGVTASQLHASDFAFV